MYKIYRVSVRQGLFVISNGDHMISVCMLKLCYKSICKPLSIIFKSCLTQGIFPSEWKKANVPIHKKRQAVCYKLQTCLTSPNLKQSFRTYYLHHDVHIFHRKQLNTQKPIRI